MEIRIDTLIFVNLAAGFIFAPLLSGIINRVKALFAGRKGRPILQLYYDLAKLLAKGAVYSRTTSWVFYTGPLVGLAAFIVAALLVPVAGHPPLFSFTGDLILFIYLFGLARFFMVCAALDTGSSFEGMGASREMHFALLAEPAFFLVLAVLARQTNELSLAGIFHALNYRLWNEQALILALASASLFMVFLAENCRVPVDDPDTHLELTMIHEVMVLDHSGPDFAFILYAASLKMWLLGSLLVGLLFPVAGRGLPEEIIFLLGMAALAVAVGIVESLAARLRLLKVPLMLLGAGALAVLSMVFTIMR